eukprot:COSAG01_NODE_17370_length_1153_cov_9.179754_1_plen_85_part_00
MVETDGGWAPTAVAEATRPRWVPHRWTPGAAASGIWRGCARSGGAAAAAAAAAQGGGSGSGGRGTEIAAGASGGQRGFRPPPGL